jgi:general stress protein YciG
MAQNNNENLNDENLTSSNEQVAGPSKRGFGSMDENKQREIASKGGKAAHQKGTAHEFTSEEAKRAGQKGGQARQGTGTEKLDDIDSAIDSNFDDALDR